MTQAVEIAKDPSPCFAIRRSVFVEEQGFAETDEWDALDEGAVHLLIRDGGAPVATARLLLEADTGRIGRICVLKSHRGTGLGADLVRFGIAHFRAQAGVGSAVLGAQVRAMGFYTKLGFEPEGAVYDDGGVPHQEMRLCF